MKKLVLCMIMAVLCCGIGVAQTGDSYYVSAQGDDRNDGLSEDKPFKSLFYAFTQALDGTIKKITVIGTLNETSETFSSNFKDELFGALFFIDDSTGKNTTEILITGKPGASGSEQAVLSAKGSQAGVLFIGNNVKLRFEHIEISGGEKNSNSNLGHGIRMQRVKNSTITLGPGVLVRGNQGFGIEMTGGSCTLDGGEIRENLQSSVGVSNRATFTMRNGIIKDNKVTGNGGGVFVNNGGTFTMSGGTITGNSSEMAGGGVCVVSGGRFDQTGGTITANTAKQGSNVYRQPGSLGSDLVTPSSSSSSTRPSSGGSSSSSSGASTPPQKANAVEFAGSFGFDLRGLYPEPFSLGIPLQLGVEFNFSSMSIALLGEAAVGLGFPGFTESPFWELSYGAMGEFYFPGKKFGLGAGIGAFGDSMSNLTSDDTTIPAHDPIYTTYTRFALIFKGMFKTTLYAQLYGTGGFGFGLQWGTHW